MDLLSIIKQAGIAAVDAQNPVQVVVAKAESISPLTVNIEQRLQLTQEFLWIPESMTRHTAKIKHGEYEQEIVIREGIQVGDSLLLLRVQGGQKYIVLDKVV